ncbi:MAG: alanyl-tRNA editing protein [Armatimonadota bacterium]|nr:alanyl-tRNA editing protein [Armatimonadota bacterium]
MGATLPFAALRYLHDAYAREETTHVRAVEGARVQLASTVLFPGGGGQPSDRGWLRWDGGEAAVVGHAHPAVEGDPPWHAVAGPVPPPGATVQVVVDWEHRYAVMRHHTALHVLSGVVYHLFGASVTGGQIYPDRARMDFALVDLDRARVEAIEREANRIITEGRPVRVRFVSREAFAREDLVRTARNLVPAHLETIRVVEIEGFDAQADGGTHVGNTAEVGRLVVTGTENKGKVNRRLYVALRL